MDDRLEEILSRLEALERRLGADAPGPPAPRSQPPTECGFRAEERRIVDLIVRLTTENVVRALDERLSRQPPPPPPAPPGWGHPPRGPHGRHR